MKTRSEHVRKQVVVPVPDAAVVEGKEEQSGPLEGHQHRVPVAAAGDRVTQRPAEAVEEGGADEEVPRLDWLMSQHLVDQVVDDVPVVAGEPFDELAGVLAAFE
jgi:hypothetical protein